MKRRPSSADFFNAADFGMNTIWPNKAMEPTPLTRLVYELARGPTFLLQPTAASAVWIILVSLGLYDLIARPCKEASQSSIGPRAPKPGIGFAYYLNPTPNDRNIEFDPKRNLFTNLKTEEQVTAP